MIYLFCGKIRVGKTSLMTYLGILNALNADKRAKMRAAVKSLRARGFAVSAGDYALYADYNITYDNMHGQIMRAIKIDPLKINKTVYLKPHSTLLISETQGYFNSRRSMLFTPDQALFFQTSGHFGVDIFLDCQDIDTVDKTIRNLSTVLQVTDRRIYDMRGRQTDYADSRDFSAIKWDVTIYDGAREFEKQKGVKKTYTANFNVFDTYNSFERYDNFLPRKDKGDFDFDKIII